MSTNAHQKYTLNKSCVCVSKFEYVNNQHTKTQQTHTCKRTLCKAFLCGVSAIVTAAHHGGRGAPDYKFWVTNQDVFLIEAPACPLPFCTVPVHCMYLAVGLTQIPTKTVRIILKHLFHPDNTPSTLSLVHTHDLLINVYETRQQQQCRG